MKTISVIISFYNRAGFIAETLSSIEKQTLKPYEVLLIDDGSADHSVDVIKKFQETSKLNIIVLKNKFTKGQSGALNFGIQHAKGEMIAINDSDDLWTPMHLQKLYEALMGYPEACMAFSAIEIFGPARDRVLKANSFKISVQRCLTEAFERDGQGVWVSNGRLLESLLMHGVPFRCPASLIRKEFFLKQNLYFDPEITYTQDAHFMTLASYFTSFLYVETVGLRIRRHAENDGDKAYGDRISVSYDIRSRKLKEFFAKHKISSEEKRALNHRLWNLQTYIAEKKSLGKGLGKRTRTALKLVKKVPTGSSVKSAVKLLMGLSLTGTVRDE